ncbi:MAG TPA: aromatic ring-hydroxylating dioxygenase subunit alpha [Gemmatimonadaceae bacterium]|nr:aromatic ring-hydroxylating dioxygenase subunit alpha [Gemmatimonadaceae bacterium]
MTTFHKTVSSYQSGARTMPREAYIDPDVLIAERERIFARQWNCVGRASRLANPGDFVVRDVAGESIIIVRDRTGELRALFNVCRHRGTRICREASGQFSETIRCPYHAWTYTTDGRLIGAPHMQDVEGFDKRDFPLHAAAVAEWEGFVFVNIDTQPQPFDEWFGPMLDRLSRYGIANLRVGHGVAYDVKANWKLVFQNYSECLHCPMIHPELSTVLPYQSGANDLVEGPFLGGYMEITSPNESATLSGRACGRLVNPTLPADDRHRAFYYTLMPNLMLSIHPDYVNYYLLTPVAVDRTIVESEWMFHPGNEGDASFNPADAIGFWDVTNRQDWDIVEQSQLGIASRRYEPGPYSPRESIPAAWDREYQRLIRG